MYTLQTITGEEILSNLEVYRPHLPSLVEVLNLTNSKLKRSPEILFTLLEEPHFKNLAFHVLLYDNTIVGFTKYSNYPSTIATEWATVLSDNGFTTSDYRIWKADVPTSLSKEVEILKNETFKINRQVVVDFLNRKWSESIALLRMICSNTAYLPEKSYHYNTFLHRTTDVSQLITQPNTTMPTVMHLRAHLSSLINEKASAEDILTSYNTVKTLPQVPQHTSLRNALLDIYETYELHTPLTTKTESEDVRIFAIQIQPLGWRKTAIHDTVRKWDVWNDATYIISRAEERGVDTETIRSANIKVSTILSVKQPIVIARRREKPQTTKQK